MISTSLHQSIECHFSWGSCYYRPKWSNQGNLNWNYVWFWSFDVIILISGKFPLLKERQMGLNIAVNIWSVWHDFWYPWSSRYQSKGETAKITPVLELSASSPFISLWSKNTNVVQMWFPLFYITMETCSSLTNTVISVAQVLVKTHLTAVQISRRLSHKFEIKRLKPTSHIQAIVKKHFLHRVKHE